MPMGEVKHSLAIRDLSIDHGVGTRMDDIPLI
jgi:hypothetical protein